MKHTTTAALVIISAVAGAGCRTAQREPDATPAAGRSAPTPLEEYRRVFSALHEQQRDNRNLLERIARLREEIDELYARLAQEQKLRREAQLALDSAKAQVDAAAAAQQTISNLRTALDNSKTELAAVKTELKARREELMKIILGQQEWNKYILDKLKLQR